LFKIEVFAKDEVTHRLYCWLQSSKAEKSAKSTGETGDSSHWYVRSLLLFILHCWAFLHFCALSGSLVYKYWLLSSCVYVIVSVCKLTLFIYDASLLYFICFRCSYNLVHHSDLDSFHFISIGCLRTIACATVIFQLTLSTSVKVFFYILSTDSLFYL